jgi:hypothetical protein
MTEITWEIRRGVLQESTMVKSFLYCSSDSASKLIGIAKKYNILIQTESYKKFATTIGDIILGFYKIEDTVPLLQQELGLDPKTAALLGADVIEFLSPLSDPTWQPPQGAVAEGDEPALDTTAPTATFKIPVKAPAPVGSVAPTATPVPPVATPLHTYADDLASVRGTEPTRSYEQVPEPEQTPTYSSTQPIRQPLSPLPTYASAPTPVPQVPAPSPDRPRWSSEL